MRNVLERLTFKTGDKIFREGDKGYQAFIIQEGDVDIVKNVDSQEAVIATVGKGGIIGEMALIDNSPRMATARAASNCVVIVVTAEVFTAKMNKTDPFIRGLLKILADHSRHLSEENAALHFQLNQVLPSEEKADQ